MGFQRFFLLKMGGFPKLIGYLYLDLCAHGFTSCRLRGLENRDDIVLVEVGIVAFHESVQVN